MKHQRWTDEGKTQAVAAVGILCTIALMFAAFAVAVWLLFMLG